MRFFWQDPPTTDKIPIDEGFRNFCLANRVYITSKELTVEMIMFQALWKKIEDEK